MQKFLSVFLLLLTFVLLRAGECYKFFMISDTHFGSSESFSEKITGSRRTRADKAMVLYRKLFADMAAKSDSSTKFLIHAGDVIEGYAKDDLTQQKEFERSVALLKDYFSFPVYFVRGNHETSGGANGYINGLLPEISRSAGKELTVANYSFSQGRDLFIFIDCYSPGYLSFIDRSLREHKGDIRYLFVVLHSDLLLPFRDNAAKRIMQKLAGFNTLILHGHTHCTVKLSQNINGKSITAFSVGTCLSSPRSYPSEAVTDFSKQLARINRQAGFERYPVKKAYFDRESLPYISGFQDFSNNGFAQGYAEIHVSDDGVYALIQGTDFKQKPLRVELIGTEKNTKNADGEK
ncbi:MAG: metallophosphoesterase [Lentisphaeria bacterium]|nr:metallophosphoesterase [Lentisphaeria bacterium]